MQMLYNSDQYAVVQFDPPTPDGSPGAAARGGFEIVDKLLRREIYIEGAVAERFKAGVLELSEGQSDADDFDAFIAHFAAHAQQTLHLH